jgi:uncharacterized delta-60 repeat protein
MKKDRVCVLAFFIILFLAWVAGPCAAEKVRTAWTSHYEAGDKVIDLVMDSSGNIYVTGTTDSNGPDIVTVKYDSSGTLLWEARYRNAEGEDGPGALKVDGAGNVYVTGYCDGGRSGYDWLTIKYNSSGKQVWFKRLNNPENHQDYANDIVLDKAGNVYITGCSRYDATDLDIVTVKYSPSGALKWAKRLSGPGILPNWRDDNGRCIGIDKAGNIYVAGYSESSSRDIVTIKFKSSGQVLWDKRYDGPDHGNDEPSGLAVDTDGNVYVTGNSYGSGTSEDMFLIKYSASGEQKWVERYTSPGEGPEDAQDIFLDKSGNVYVTGSGNFSGHNKFVTLKYDPTGARKWVALYALTYSSGAYSIDGDDSGNVYVTGGGMTETLIDKMVTIKYNAQGKKKWTALYSGPNKDDDGRAIALDPSGAVIVAGESWDAGWVIIKYIQEF